MYKCSVCGQPLCGEHSRLRTVCLPCCKKSEIDYRIGKTSEKEKAPILGFVKRFWGEEEQLTFDREFLVSELPGYVAKVEEKIAGFISFATIEDATIIVALAVLPEYQRCGMAKRLVNKVQNEAAISGKKKLLVSTSNDDLPALGFYQSQGFQIYEVKPDAIAEKHGRIFKGVGNLPIRDELRMRKEL
jgi:ribosomal protein S18 acetylase RimI-like enzyme